MFKIIFQLETQALAYNISLWVSCYVLNDIRKEICL